MQGIQCPQRGRTRKGVERACQHYRGKLQYRNPPYKSTGRLTVGFGQPSGMKRRPHLVFKQPAGDQGLVPKRIRWAAILG